MSAEDKRPRTEEEMEEVLDQIRAGRLSVDGPVVGKLILQEEQDAGSAGRGLNRLGTTPMPERRPENRPY